MSLKLFQAAALMALLFVASPAGAVAVATFDAAQFRANGFAFADFDDFDAIDPTGDVLRLNIANDIDTSDPNAGLFGGAGSDLAATFDSLPTQLEVTFEVQPGNTATDFRVVLVDNDGPGSGEEYQFFFDISGVPTGVSTTLVQNLLNPGPVFRQAAFNQADGDMVQNFGLTQIQIQSAYGGTAPLVIDLESIKVVDAENTLVAELTTSTFAAQTQSFTFGTFSDPGALDQTSGAFVINADPTAASGPGGGVGFNGLNIDFDAETHQLEVEARILPGNTADSFNILLGDNDGDDSGPGMGSEDFLFNIPISAFNGTEFTTFTLPLGSGSESGIVTTFDFNNGGDGLQNFDLSQIQIQVDTPEGVDPSELGILNIEILRASIVQIPDGATLPGDFNDDGVVDSIDYALWRDNLGGDEGVLNGNGDGSGTVDTADFDVWVDNFGATADVPGASTAPEAASALLLLSMLTGVGMFRNPRTA